MLKLKNTPDDIMVFIGRLKQLENFMIAKTVFCMEHTGVYCNHLLTVLQRFKANFVMASAIHIKNSLGNIRGKHDKIDAIRIGEYAYRNREDHCLWQAKREVIQKLARLNTLRTRVVGIIQAMKVAMGEEVSFVKKNVAKLIGGGVGYSIIKSSEIDVSILIVGTMNLL